MKLKVAKLILQSKWQAHSGEHEGSNPLAPTEKEKRLLPFLFFNWES